MRASQLDITVIHATALAACKKATRWVYRNQYCTGEVTISRREPDSHTRHLTGVRSWNYANEAGCTSSVARSHLRKLVRAGLLIEVPRRSSACDFKLPPDDADTIGRALIAELRAEGLPFDDEWRTARDAATGAGGAA